MYMTSASSNGFNHLCHQTSTQGFFKITCITMLSYPKPNITETLQKGENWLTKGIANFCHQMAIVFRRHFFFRFLQQHPVVSQVWECALCLWIPNGSSIQTGGSTLTGFSIPTGPSNPIDPSVLLGFSIPTDSLIQTGSLRRKMGLCTNSIYRQYGTLGSYER